MFLIGVFSILSLPVTGVYGNIQFTTPDKGTLGKVWYARKGSNITIPCVTEESPGDKYKGALYSWRERGPNGRGLLGFRRSILGNGTLLMSELQPTDTKRMECRVSRFETSKTIVFVHSLVVYHVADFLMINPFVYTVPSCSESRISSKAHSLLEYLCQEHSNSGAICPFSASKDCIKKPFPEVVAGEGRYRLRILIEQMPEKHFVVPDCSLKCMKKSIIAHLQKNGDELLRRLADKEEKSKGRLFAGYVFEKEELLNRHIKTVCYGGYEVLHFIICMPCFPGSYMKYTFHQSSSQTRVSSCSSCARDFYQENFAMDTCERCPRQGATKTNSTDDAKHCSVTHWKITYIYYIIGGVIVLVTIISCITVCCIIAQRTERAKQARMQQLEEERSLIADTQTTFPQTENASTWAPSQFTATATTPGPPYSRQSFAARSNNAVVVPSTVAPSASVSATPRRSQSTTRPVSVSPTESNNQPQSERSSAVDSDDSGNEEVVDTDASESTNKED